MQKFKKLMTFLFLWLPLFSCVLNEHKVCGT